VTTRIAIIPARGGSKRIPGKNIRDFCGNPVISYPLNAARESRLFDRIHVSTDSQEIVDVVQECGFPVDFMRPESLADDYTPIMPVLKFVVEEYSRRGEQFDEIWFFMPCAPLISVEDLHHAAALYEERKARALQCIVEYPVPIEWAYEKDETNVLKPVQPGMFATRSQDIEKKYYDAAAFYAYKSELVLGSTGAGSDMEFVGYLLPKNKVVDIDDAEDWAVAEALYRAQH